jgi:hypothetical protein
MGGNLVTIQELIAACDAMGVIVWPGDGEAIRVSPARRLPDALKEELRAHKADVLAYIARRSSSSAQRLTEQTQPPAKVISIPYQRISFDWSVADGNYTPEQLRKAKLLVKPWGPVQTYAMNGNAHDIADEGITLCQAPSILAHP